MEEYMKANNNTSHDDQEPLKKIQKPSRPLPLSARKRKNGKQQRFTPMDRLQIMTGMNNKHKTPNSDQSNQAAQDNLQNSVPARDTAGEKSQTSPIEAALPAAKHSSDSTQTKTPPNIHSKDEYPTLPPKDPPHAPEVDPQKVPLPGPSRDHELSDEDSDGAMDAEDFINPKKTARVPPPVKDDAVALTNKFSALSTTGKENAPPPPKTSRPPPIFIYNIQNKFQFTKTISAVCKIKPLYQHTSEYIKLQVQTQEDYNKLQTYCKQTNTRFSTEISKAERLFKVVIRKLPEDTPPEDILQDLLDLGYPAQQVSQMFGKDKVTQQKKPFPLFLASFRRQTDNKNIYDLQYLLSYRVAIETYRPPEILQCFKCQRLNHSQQTCFLDPRCVKCGEGHLARDCPKKTRDTPAKCANCKGDHPANYRGCQMIKAALEKRRLQNAQNTSPKTIPTPTPLKNASNTLHEAVKNKTTSFAEKVKPKQNQITPNPPAHITASTGTPKKQIPAPIPAASPTPEPTASDDQSDDASSMGSTFRELFALFMKLKNSPALGKIKRGLAKYKLAKDADEKITIIAEVIFSLLDDGTS